MTPDQTLPPREALFDAPSIVAACARALELGRRGELRRALALALHARSQAQALSIGEAELAALDAAAIIHAIRGDFPAAVATALDTWVLARRHGNRSIQRHARVTLCNSAFALGAFPGVREAFAECVPEAQAEGDGALEARARIGFGVALGDLGGTCARIATKRRRSSSACRRRSSRCAHCRMRRTRPTCR